MDTETMTIEVTLHPTRNPDAVAFRVNRPLLGPGTGNSYPNAETAINDPIAHALFQIRGVASVWILGNEVLVTKDEKVSWGRVNSRVVETIKRVVG